MRTRPSAPDVRGDFAGGLRGTRVPLSPHTGDFAAGVRARLQDALVLGDFACGLRGTAGG
ncbi:MAG TPA: hypothetical protein VH834_20860 [Solirubrobacteraceae bacterium]|jgi:hypothetical protein